MRNAIAIGMLGLVLFSTKAAAQTAAEQAQILRDFDHSVVLYAQRHQCLTMFPEAINAATPAPKIFTLPVAMVFRQMIARSLVGHAGEPAIFGVGIAHRAAALEPFPSTDLFDFPQRLADTLPPLPAPLEYRLIFNDLVIRDADADLIVAVLRDAVGSFATTTR
jgi:hypothetical protein